MIITVCLAIMGVLTLFSFILGNTLFGNIISDTFASDIIVNGTTQSLEFSKYSETFAIDPTLGAIAILLGIIAIAGILGIQAIGSGLSPTSIKIIMTALMYFIMWGLLSILSEPLISSIKLMGSFIYVGLTVMYIIGVVQKISGGSE